MNEELNTDDFESWLKKGADKHRMYPSDQLWRNINQELHGNRRWPALTFGAILTGALVTATLIFLRPDKDLFNLPVLATNNIQKEQVTSPLNKNNIAALPNSNVQTLKPVDDKEAIYSFNFPVKRQKEITEPTYEPTSTLANKETLALNEPVSQPLQATIPAFVSNVKAPKPVASADYVVNAAGFDPELTVTDVAEASTKTVTGLNATPDIAEELEENTNGAKTTIRLPEIKKSRWNLELYGGPNINYRRLTENRPYDYHLPYNATLVANNRSNVNNVVKQRPSVGFNIGTALTYAVSDRIKIKAGIQFNYRQYTIDAFRSKLERSVLLLNNGYIYPDSVYTFSVISNEQGNSAITLNNRYYQLSAPVAVEWMVAKLNKFNINLASSIQPTYQINGNVYQITSDYKSYVQAPRLLRRLNFNASAEATANFMAGGLQWQVGPQLRYQLMPSQKDNYSIREHLVDYGIRVGIIKQLR